MKRVLLTGMSGTGKSSVIGELAALGYKAVDTDDGWCEPLPNGRQRWREDAVAALLDAEDADVLFLAGCEENQVRFHPRFDLIILLSAPAQTMIERLAARTGNQYGKAPGDMDLILGDLAAVEPLLRKAADHEIRTNGGPVEPPIRCSAPQIRQGEASRRGATALRRRSLIGWRILARCLSDCTTSSSTPATCRRWPGIWTRALGWQVLSEREREIVIGPDVNAPVGICFMPVTDAKIVKNRVHVDLTSTTWC